MILLQEYIGWHGIGEIKIIAQKDCRVVVDISSWVDKNGEAEWKEGIMIKKKFTPHILITTNAKWNAEKKIWECDDFYIGKGYAKGNKFYAHMSRNIPQDKNLCATFPHKVKQTKQKNGSTLLSPTSITQHE